MTVSGLHMPVNAVESVNNSGTVVAYGFLWVHDDEDPDSAPRKIPIPDMEIGLRVMFIRFLGEVHTTKAMQAVIGDEIIKMDASDILAIGVP
jgi:co-chaperonin GroES (HSP10)